MESSPLLKSDPEDTFYSLDLNHPTAPDGSPEQPPSGSRGGSGSTFPKVHSRFGFHGGDALHAGVGLEQLSGCGRGDDAGGRVAGGPSRPGPRRTLSVGNPPPSHGGGGGSGEKTWDMARDPLSCTVTVAGATLAMLQTDVYLYAAPVVPREGEEGEEAEMLASVDEGGVDPSRYLKLMSRLLAQRGVNRKALQASGDDLAELLPRDHFL